MWRLLGMEWTPFASLSRMKSHLDANYFTYQRVACMCISVGELEIKSIKATNLKE